MRGRTVAPRYMSISHGNDHAAGALNIDDSASSAAEAKTSFIEGEGEEDVALDTLTGISGISFGTVAGSLYISIAAKKIAMF